jgi:hypothetical protein
VATYYISDNQSGAHASAVPGNNANAGTSMAAPKRTPDSINFAALAAGDQVLFAQGGAWDGVEVELFAAAASANNPIVIDSYAPPSGATGKPILRGSGYLFLMGDYFSSTVNAGYIFRGLNMIGTAANRPGTNCAIVPRGANQHITVDDCELSNFGIGVYCITGSTSDHPSFINVKNCNLHHNGQGFLGSAADITFENNIWNKNGQSQAVDPGNAGREHHLYINGHGADRVRIRNNSFYDAGNADTDGTVASQGAITAHGEFDQLVIEGNRIINQSQIFGGVGISVTQGYGDGYAEEFARCVIRDNLCVHAAIHVDSAPGAIIENNRVVWLQTDSEPLLWIPARTYDPNDVHDTAAKIRNNSFYYGLPEAGAVAVRCAGNGGIGNNVEFTNNLIVMGSSSGTTGIVHDTLSHYTAHNNNLVYGAGAWSSSYSTLAAAQAAGFDANSSNSNPLLVAVPSSANGYAMKLQAGSPALGAGNATYRARLAVDGWLRPTVPSIGAFDANNP